MSNVENISTVNSPDTKTQSKVEKPKKVLKPTIAEQPTAMLEPIADGVKAIRKLEYTGAHTVLAWYSVKPSENDGRRFQLKQTFDFSNVDDADMKALAMSSAIILQQKVFRSASPNEQLDAAMWSGVVDVASLMHTQRAPRIAGPRSELRKAMVAAGVNEEQLIELMRTHINSNGVGK
jgi:hypothetical protein